MFIAALLLIVFVLPFQSIAMEEKKSTVQMHVTQLVDILKGFSINTNKVLMQPVILNEYKEYLKERIKGYDKLEKAYQKNPWELYSSLPILYELEQQDLERVEIYHELDALKEEIYKERKGYFDQLTELKKEIEA